MELRSQVFEGKLLHPGEGFTPAGTRLELRWDPLTGHSSRLVSSPDELFPPNTYDLARLAEETRADCPFCPDLVETATPKFPPEVWPAGRVRRGRALLFPNLRVYAKHPSVAVYAPELHYLPLAQLDAALLGDNLATQADFARAVLAADPASVWVSINANHMLSSGSSLFHPHTQGAAHPQPTTMQGLLAAVPPERYEDYLATERRLGRRHLGSTGSIEWLASFAPLGPAELRAFVPGAASPVELDGDRLAELAHGIAVALGLYAELGFECFNLALYGAPPGTAGYSLNLRMLVRSNLDTPYRSDATFLERLHWEAALDLTITPEAVAERAGDRFRR
jgi:UDPglucose--hexose-1-phosphate uridylyltransferase